LVSDESNTEKLFSKIGNTPFGEVFKRDINYQIIKASPQIIELLKA